MHGWLRRVLREVRCILLAGGESKMLLVERLPSRGRRRVVVKETSEERLLAACGCELVESSGA